MHWYTEFVFSKDNIKQSSNNLDYQGQHHAEFTEEHTQCRHKHIPHIKHSRIVHKYMHNTLMALPICANGKAKAAGEKRRYTRSIRCRIN